MAGQLPDERTLARQLQVSRSTLRVALGHLRDEGLVKTRKGHGHEVLNAPKRSSRRRDKPSIGMLLPTGIDRWRQFVTLVVDDLRARLHERNYGLELHVHPQAPGHSSHNHLASLVEKNRHAAWVLIGCSDSTQKWFARKKLPVVVSGTSDPRLGLPTVVLDNYALGRHAALTLLRLGHRHVGVVIFPGNPALREGLNDGWKERSARNLKVETIEIRGEGPARLNALSRLLKKAAAPTALFLGESELYLMTISLLGQLRIRVPQEISLLCRDDEPYLDAIYPSPARYTKNPHNYATHLDDFIRKLTEGEPIAQKITAMMPVFLPGESLQKKSVPCD